MQNIFPPTTIMEIYRKRIIRGTSRFLILTDDDPKTRIARAVIVDMQAQTIQRVRSVPTLLRTEAWQPLAKSDPTLDELVQRVPALRPYRGIEIRLSTGETAWIRWRQWSSGSAAVQKLLTKTTGSLTVPKFEMDGDYFLAVQAVTICGGEVLDAPRSVLSLGSDGY